MSKKRFLSIAMATAITLTCAGTIYGNCVVMAEGTSQAIATDATENNLSWLPHTVAEYDAFVEKYGYVSIHEKYIVYCDEINYSTGADVIMEQLGTAEIKEVKRYSIKADEDLADGNESYCVYVYEAITSGTVKVTISQGQPWNLEQSKQVKDESNYEVAEDLTIKKIEEIPMSIKCDVNNDGEFNIADVVLFQKWLLAVPDIELKNWKAADLCEDDRLDVFDLCLMKRELIEKTNNTYPVENPEVIDEFTPCTATMDDDFMDWKIRIIIKCQYSVPDRTWTADDFYGIENIKKIKQYFDMEPYRQVLEISLSGFSKEDVLNTIHAIEDLGLKEIKEVSTVTYMTGDV